MLLCVLDGDGLRGTKAPGVMANSSGFPLCPGRCRGCSIVAWRLEWVGGWGGCPRLWLHQACWSGAHTGLQGAAWPRLAIGYHYFCFFWVESLLKKLTWTCDRNCLLWAVWCSGERGPDPLLDSWGSSEDLYGSVLKLEATRGRGFWPQVTW